MSLSSSRLLGFIAAEVHDAGRRPGCAACRCAAAVAAAARLRGSARRVRAARTTRTRRTLARVRRRPLGFAGAAPAPLRAPVGRGRSAAGAAGGGRLIRCRRGILGSHGGFREAYGLDLIRRSARRRTSRLSSACAVASRVVRFERYQVGVRLVTTSMLIVLRKHRIRARPADGIAMLANTLALVESGACLTARAGNWVLAVEIALAVVIVLAVGWHFRNILQGHRPGAAPAARARELLVPAGSAVPARAPVLVHVLGAAAALGRRPGVVVRRAADVLRQPVREVHSGEGRGSAHADGDAAAARRTPGAGRRDRGVRDAHEHGRRGAARRAVPAGAGRAAAGNLGASTWLLFAVAALPHRAGRAEQARGADRQEEARAGRAAAARPRPSSFWHKGSCTGVRVLSAGAESGTDDPRADPRRAGLERARRTRWTWRRWRCRTSRGS